MRIHHRCAEIQDFLLSVRLNSGLAACQEGHEEQHEEYHKEHLRDPSSCTGDAAKTKNSGNEGHNKKDDCVVEHGSRGRD